MRFPRKTRSSFFCSLEIWKLLSKFPQNITWYQENKIKQKTPGKDQKCARFIIHLGPPLRTLPFFAHFFRYFPIEPMKKKADDAGRLCFLNIPHNLTKDFFFIDWDRRSVSQANCYKEKKGSNYTINVTKRADLRPGYF